MNEELNFDSNSIEKFRNSLEKRYKDNEKEYEKISEVIAVDLLHLELKPRSILIRKRDIKPVDFGVLGRKNELNLLKILKTQSRIINLKKETQEIDEKINTFFEQLEKTCTTDLFISDDFMSDHSRFQTDGSYVQGLVNLDNFTLHTDNSYLPEKSYYVMKKFRSKILSPLLSEILEIQEKNRKLLACITKLEANLQALMLMWLVVSIKQIPSFIVYLICNLNMNVFEWLRSGLGEEMMGDLTERHYELKKEYPNSNVLVSFILLGTALQMFWSVLLINLDDLMSDEEIEFYSVNMQFSLA